MKFWPWRRNIEREIPLDCIVLDWLSWVPDREHWGQKSFDPERFPEPDDMIRRLHDIHTHFMLSVWSNTREGSENHREMAENHFLLRDGSHYDAFNESARRLFWKQMNDGLFSNGVDAWWCDATEPFEADWHGDTKPEPEQRVIINTEQTKENIDPEYINAYSLMHSKGVYEGQRSVTDRKRVVNLTRSGYAGQHRYATIVWSGDISATWDTLHKQIAAGVNFCAAGEPYWTCDIGAFFVHGNPDIWMMKGEYPGGCKDPGYRELYTRWLQFGTFLPVFRSHGTDTPREVWRFGEPGERVYDTIVKFIKLRYRLIPYIYSMARAVTGSGYTMFRMLAFDFMKDKRCYNIDNQYMFGSSLLVCPVTRPMYYSDAVTEIENPDTVHKVYLPEGTCWYDFWTNEKYNGGVDVLADAPLERIPLYVPEGTILPLGEDRMYTDNMSGQDIALRIYTGKDACFTLYDDAGDGYGYENGECEEIEIFWDDKGGTISLSERIGSYPGMPETRRFHLEIITDGVASSTEDFIYTGSKYERKILL